MNVEEKDMLKGIERSNEKAHALVDRGHDLLVSGSEGAERRVEQVAGAVVQGTQSAAAKLREGAKSAQAGAHERVDGASQALDRGLSKAQQGLSDAAERTTAYVAGNPGRSLLIAAGIGFVLGMFFRRGREA